MRIAESLSRRFLYAGLIIGLLLTTGSLLAARAEQRTATKPVCADDNGGITLPAGFCATVFADNIGHARHLVVAPNGVVYVNTWSGRYYGNDTPPAGGFLVALQDTKGEGRADVKVRFGGSVQTGSAGGTGITLYRGALFAEVDDRIVRYALPATGIAPTEAPTVIVSGLPLTGDHPMHPFAMPTPKGATAAMVAQGDRLFHTNSCVGCHGSNAEGTPLGSDLTKGKWLWGDGSLAAINRTITQGVAKPKEHTGVMPPLGGAQLSPSEVSALAAYIAALNQRAER